MITSDKPVPNGTIRPPFDPRTIVAGITDDAHQTPIEQKAPFLAEFVDLANVTGDIPRQVNFAVMTLLVSNLTNQFVFIREIARYILPWTEGLVIHMPGNKILTFSVKNPSQTAQPPTPKGSGLYFCAMAERLEPNSGINVFNMYQTVLSYTPP